MAGIGPRATIVLPKGVHFQFEGVPLKFAQDVEAECAASNLPALEALVAKCGGVLATKQGQATAATAAGEVDAKLDHYQKATNQRLDTIGVALQTLLDRSTPAAPAAPVTEPAEPPAKKK